MEGGGHSPKRMGRVAALGAAASLGLSSLSGCAGSFELRIGDDSQRAVDVQPNREAARINMADRLHPEIIREIDKARSQGLTLYLKLFGDAVKASTSTSPELTTQTEKHEWELSVAEVRNRVGLLKELDSKRDLTDIDIKMAEVDRLARLIFPEKKMSTSPLISGTGASAPVAPAAPGLPAPDVSTHIENAVILTFTDPSALQETIRISAEEIKPEEVQPNSTSALVNF